MALADIGDVFALVVLPDVEGRGLGSALLLTAANWLAAHGVVKAWLLTGMRPTTKSASPRC
jgi:GNAT superfamily N-acetyltransferase